MNLLQIVAKGGILIIPIVLCSLISIGIVFERIIVLRKMRINARTFILQIKNLLLKNEVSKAVMICKRTPGPIAKITQAAIEQTNFQGCLEILWK